MTMTKEKNKASEMLTLTEKYFVSDLKNIAGAARRQAYRAADHILAVRN